MAKKSAVTKVPESIRAIAATIRQPLIVLDPRGRVLAANEPFYRTFSLAADQVANASFFELSEGRWDLPQLRDWLQRRESKCLEDAIEAGPYLIHASRASRLVFIAIESAMFPPGRGGFEERIAQSQKLEAIGRLAGGVAHDFNNMLTAIASYAAQLLSSVDESHPAYGPARQINHVVDQAATITRQLLAFSRKQVMRPSRVDLNATLRDMHDLLGRLLGDTIEIELKLAPGEQFVHADLGQLQQVILNMAINARDAMPQGGRLTLSTSPCARSARDNDFPERDFAVLCVSDTGLGMDRETLERAFEPFFTTKPPGAGTGLGLSTVYGIVQQSGGRIAVESEPGKGTDFQIYLPRDHESTEAARLPAPAGDGLGDESILVVEDTAVVRSLIRELLEQRGYTVMEARDAREALSIAEKSKKKIDLLLTDLVMPYMGGQELAKRIRRMSPETKVIYMSGYPLNGLRAENEAHFLEKPFKPVVLAAFVRKVLES